MRLARARPDRSLECLDVVFDIGARGALDMGTTGRPRAAVSGLCTADSAASSCHPVSEALIAKLPTPLLRRSSIVGLAAITLGYIPIAHRRAHDYARWVSTLGRVHVPGHACHPLLPSAVSTADAPPLAPRPRQICSRARSSRPSALASPFRFERPPGRQAGHDRLQNSHRPSDGVHPPAGDPAVKTALIEELDAPVGSLQQLAEAERPARGARLSPRYAGRTRPERTSHAAFMLVGEQPGDEEDLAASPSSVQPAGC